MKCCIFHDAGPARKERLLFDIVEDAYNRRAKALVFASSETRAEAIDRVLWTLRQEAFIPHKIFDPHDVDLSVPVAIVTAEFNPIEAGILVADGHCSIEFACGFDLIHEFVDRTSPEIQEACRDRYRAYRERRMRVEHVKE